MDEDGHGHLGRRHSMPIGEERGERVKKAIGSACLPEEGEGRTMKIKGRAVVRGVPAEIVITEREVAQSLAESVGAVIDAIDAALRQTGPELAAEIVGKGIVLTGGGAPPANPGRGGRAPTRGPRPGGSAPVVRGGP